MKIKRKTALKILKYQFKHRKFNIPFSIMCKNYASEDNDFVEIWTDDYDSINEDKSYTNFELWLKLSSNISIKRRYSKNSTQL